jgi:thiosulfate dehydrogenase
MPDQGKDIQQLISVINKLIWVVLILVIAIVSMPFILYNTKDNKPVPGESVAAADTDTTIYWMAPEISTITDSAKRSLVEYGKELIAHTSKYLGPKGSVMQMSNGMNCQNCHLQAGTATWGNNYGSVASLYPKFRARSGSIENLFKRVNDCFQRSLNGKALDTTSKEMQAISAYINFVGSNVAKGVKASGSGLKDLAYLDRAADPARGQKVYTEKCQSCHQANGSGVYNTDSTEFTYPALWAKNSFNMGAGLYRLSSFARYVKYNMPQGVTYKNTQLTDEEAWDVAAFVLSQPRPTINISADWPDISKKPFDHPFGPYADKFTEAQHKYGPFLPIIEEQKKAEKANKNPTSK